MTQALSPCLPETLHPYFTPPPPFPDEPPTGVVTLAVPGVTVEATRFLERKARAAGLSTEEFLRHLLEQISMGPLHLYWPQIETEGEGCIVLVPHFQFQATPPVPMQERTVARLVPVPASLDEEEMEKLDDRV
jgi:hypothetical protein